MIQRLAIFTLLAMAASCAPDPAPLTEVLNPTGVSVHAVVGESEPGATKYALGDSSVYLASPEPFQFSRLFKSADDRGRLAIGFSIVKEDQERFEAWTTLLTGSRMAVVIGDRVITAPTINDPLRTGGQITGGNEGFTDEEVQSMLQSMVSAPE